LHALGEFEVIPINHNDFASEALLNAVTDADVVIHLAGINRNGINSRSVDRTSPDDRHTIA